MQPAISFQENVGLVHLQAKKAFKWASGANTGMTYEDCFQEASLAFVLAAQGYDPDAGVKFSAYYTQVAFSQFHKAIGRMTGVKRLSPDMREEIEARKAENERRAAQALPPLPDINYSLPTENFSTMSAMGEEGGDPFEASLASETQSPEDIVAFNQLWQQATANLSPLAKLMVEWLRDPPPELLKELDCQIAYAEEAAACGRRAYGMRDGISINNVSKFIGMIGDVSKRELTLAEAELMEVVKRIEGA